MSVLDNAASQRDRPVTLRYVTCAEITESEALAQVARRIRRVSSIEGAALQVDGADALYEVGSGRIIALCSDKRGILLIYAIEDGIELIAVDHVEQLILARDVAEERRLSDLRELCNLAHGYLVELLRAQQCCSGRLDRVALALLAALSHGHLWWSGHDTIPSAVLPRLRCHGCSTILPSNPPRSPTRCALAASAKGSASAACGRR